MSYSTSLLKPRILAALFFVGTILNAAPAIQLNEFPRDKMIFDTGAQLGLNYAVLPLSGTCDTAGAVIAARAVSLDDGGASSTDWVELATTKQGKWSGKINVPRSTSWLRVEVRVGQAPDATIQMENRFGAGHVWAIYEQSNWARLLQNNSALPKNDPLHHPGDVFIFKSNGMRIEVVDNGKFSPSLAAIANALSAERPGEKFAIAFHTQSGTDPRDMLTTKEEDAQYGTNGKRDWNNEVALHKNLTGNDLTPVGLVTINGWIAFGGGRPKVANTFTQLFLGKTIDGTPVTAEAINIPRLMTEFYDWTYTRLAWVGPHGRDNIGKKAADVKSLADLPGYGRRSDEAYEKLVDTLRANFGQPHLPETLGIVMETYGGVRGAPRKNSWYDWAHYGGNTKDGREMLARLGMAATLKTLGLVDWPVPVFNRRYDAPDGSYVDYWMEGYNITTLRHLRAANGTLGDYASEIPPSFPHRTEVMGWEINGVPAERVELVKNAGGSSNRGVRVYPNQGMAPFDANSEIVYGPGSYVANQIRVEDPRDGIHLNYPVVDVGQKDLPALPIQPRSNLGLQSTPN